MSIVPSFTIAVKPCSAKRPATAFEASKKPYDSYMARYTNAYLLIKIIACTARRRALSTQLAKNCAGLFLLPIAVLTLCISFRIRRHTLTAVTSNDPSATEPTQCNDRTSCSLISEAFGATRSAHHTHVAPAVVTCDMLPITVQVKTSDERRSV